LAVALAGLAAPFVADIVYVTTRRTTLVAIPILITVFGLRRLGARGTLRLVVGCAAVAAVLWVSSPYMRFRVSSLVNEVSLYRAEDAVTSSGLRMEFWRKSLQFVAQAPLIGHGTGTIHALLSKAVNPGGGASSVASSNPHQQILAVAIQLGLIGAVVLLAVWAAHLVMFAQVGFLAWCGLIIVTQNVVGAMFNSHHRRRATKPRCDGRTVCKRGARRQRRLEPGVSNRFRWAAAGGRLDVGEAKRGREVGGVKVSSIPNGRLKHPLQVAS
jgi:O-antigen ligase